MQDGIGDEFRWFDFRQYAGFCPVRDTTDLLSEAGMEGQYIFGDSRVFRRMYALIFYYRYENSDIVAVQHQLAHFDLQATRIYLTDPVSRRDVESIFFVMPTEAEDRRRAFMDNDSDLEKEMRAVGEEKMAEEVYGVLAGQRFAGGFAKYVRRMHLKFCTLTSFKNIDINDAVLKAVRRRGHFPRPYPHGECMLGSAPQKNRAHCYSAQDGIAHFEHASPKVCGGCMYHLTKVEYLQSLRADESRILNEIASGLHEGFALERKQTELSDLSSAIVLISERLGVPT
ncbi:hypothetical protein BGC_04930 [Burkholderia sp. 3C]